MSAVPVGELTMRSRLKIPPAVNLQKKLHYQAKRLRRDSTPAEQKLWFYLRGYRIFPVRFRRQYPINQFIVDFCCYQKKLIIEIDGDIHNDRKDQDDARTKVLEHYGFTVIRFKNDQVLYTIEEILKTIGKHINKAPLSPE